MIELIRFAHTIYGTFGRMISVDGTGLFTCENRWLDNRENISCILPEPGDQEMVYDLVRDTTGRFQHYRFLDVPGRDAVEIHVGNTDLDTRGCVLVGTGMGWINERVAVTNSNAAVAILHSKLGDATHKVRVSWSLPA
jgi:hypothetical protein